MSKKVNSIFGKGIGEAVKIPTGEAKLHSLTFMSVEVSFVINVQINSTFLNDIVSVTFLRGNVVKSFISESNQHIGNRLFSLTFDEIKVVALNVNIFK